MAYVVKIFKFSLLGFSSLLLSAFMPMMTMTVSADSTTCTPPSQSQPGVHWPTGSSAGTFTYQCSGTYSGEWTNQYYVFNPTTDSQTPLYAPNYSYDCTSGVWTKDEYDYDAASSSYVLNRVQTSDPGLPTGCPVSTSNGSTSSSSASSSESQTASLSSGAADVSNGGTSGSTSLGNGGTGSTLPLLDQNGSSSNSTTGSNGSTLLNNDNQVTLTNDITQNSTSGSAAVIGNTSAGNASSGTAQSEADIINMLQSSSNVLGNGTPVETFTANVNGNVDGNLLIDPTANSAVQSTGPGSLNTTADNSNNNLTVNNSNGAAIDNTIKLASASGNATVADNTSAGNATSGTAETIANVVNTIDSAIEAGRSFIGTININGNLNGNILLPPNLVNQLLADNVPQVTLTGPASSNSSGTTLNNNSTINNTNNLGINNNINSNAVSGNATVSGNTTAGSATSGSAKTSVTAFNLTGSNIIGSNDILVFVNVTGTWVGLIMNAPPGTTAAEFGGGITTTGPNSTNASNTTVNNNSTINNVNHDQINNSISTTARSGNAIVSDNNSGGNALSGNADNAINLANIENSSINLTGWFGILFINVFGSWHGNFGISPSVMASSSSVGAVPTTGMAVFRFQPTTSTGNKGVSNNQAGNNPNSYNDSTPLYDFASTGIGSGTYPTYAVLAASTAASKSTGAPTPQLASAPARSVTKTAIIIGSLVVAYIILDAVFTNRKQIISKIRHSA